MDRSAPLQSIRNTLGIIRRGKVVIRRPAVPVTFAKAKVVEGGKAAGDSRGQSPLKPVRVGPRSGGSGRGAGCGEFIEIT